MQTDIVTGIEMFVNCYGANERAKFSWAVCNGGFEVLMEFRGIRRFAFCTHQNDAEVIVEALGQ